jgi:hypothetical protein
MSIGVCESVPPLIVSRPRQERGCPRVIKRRMKSYDLMNKPRSEYAEPRAED